jgi:hypothetical protein
MDTFQFALFFVAILIGYILVHLRLAKFELYLKEISGVKRLDERLQGVVEAMERIKVERLEEGLHQLHEDAREVIEAIKGVERKVATTANQQVEVITREGEALAAATAADRICAAIEERLFGLGYNKLHILTELAGVSLEDEVTVQVECERRMMPCKGSVTARNGRITDVDVHSVVRMFP